VILQEYIDLVSRQKYDIEPLIETLTEKVLTDEAFRQLVIDQLISHHSIMVYYHSYLIVEKASKKEPLLFYAYWDKFAPLLYYTNSYHRNYAMQIIANLTKVDAQNKFELLFDTYYRQLDDDKFLTRRYCILNSREIIKNKPFLSDLIIGKLIAFIKTSDNTEKQQNLLVSDFLNMIHDIFYVIRNTENVIGFILMLDKQTKSNKVKKQISNIISMINK
jgi:hypothetical protein